MIMEDIKRTISELEQESSLPAVGVELVDNELATLYMNSKKSEVKTTKTHSQCIWYLTSAFPWLNPKKFGVYVNFLFVLRWILGITLPCYDRLCP